MRIEIHIRDTDRHGNRVGMRNVFLESCRVYKQPGDGLRLDNLAVPACGFFTEQAKTLVRSWRDGFMAGR